MQIQCVSVKAPKSCNIALGSVLEKKNNNNKKSYHITLGKRYFVLYFLALVSIAMENVGANKKKQLLWWFESVFVDSQQNAIRRLMNVKCSMCFGCFLLHNVTNMCVIFWHLHTLRAVVALVLRATYIILPQYCVHHNKKKERERHLYTSGGFAYCNETETELEFHLFARL